MPRIRRCVVVAVLLLTWAVPGRTQAWNNVAIPGAAGRRLESVSAFSTSDAWAVGRGVYHWNGATWNWVTTPGLVSPDPLGYADTVLKSVAVVSASHTWIVGYSSFLGTPQTLVERWNGSSWTFVASPVISGGSEFDAVASLNANDAWAVGSRAGGHPEFDATAVTLTAHWDGSSWSAVPSPNVADRWHELLDVEMIASNDIWAVGDSRNLGEDYRTLILHWNGSSWSVTPSPNLPGENMLFGVSGTGPNDAWAVGSAWDGITARQIFLHWNGTAWSAVGPPGPTECEGDVIAMGPADVWAVGSRIGHWDGTAWTLVSNPIVPGSIGMSLRSLARIGSCTLWSVGSSFDAAGGDNALAVTQVCSAPQAAVDPSRARGLALRVSPNPSRDEILISLTVGSTRWVRLEILDVSGRRVRDLVSGTFDAGTTLQRWDGRDASGGVAATGLYFVRASTADRSVQARVLRLR